MGVVHKEPYIPSMVDSVTLQKLVDEHDSTQSLWKVLAKVIERLPDKSDEKENELKLNTDDLDEKFKLATKLIKIFNKKTDRLNNVIKHAKKISRSTYIEKALETIPVPPEYSSLNKKDGAKYSNVHSLLDIILPIVAGSSSPESQLKLLENRCKSILLLNNPLGESTTWKTLKAVIETLPVPPDYQTLNKKARKKYSDVHSLVNIILPIAAGSSSSESQLKLLQSRCKSVLLKNNPLGESTTWKTLKAAIETLPVPPDYKSLNKRDRMRYSAVHNLIDFILPIVAGSPSPESQRNLLENRWKQIHKEPLVESTT